MCFLFFGPKQPTVQLAPCLELQHKARLSFQRKMFERNFRFQLHLMLFFFWLNQALSMICKSILQDRNDGSGLPHLEAFNSVTLLPSLFSIQLEGPPSGYSLTVNLFLSFCEPMSNTQAQCPWPIRTAEVAELVQLIASNVIRPDLPPIDFHVIIDACWGGGYPK